ncbi:MAG TPA: response regulator [Lichenihabitans sp.]|jgi:PAS domain S-box-containing protein|nr:response regulator [Lichenihabitans sp.]
MNDVPSSPMPPQSAAPADFERLANTIPQLAWMADPSGSIFWYNKRWYDYTGTTLAEMQGRGWSKVHHPDHVARVVERYDAAFAGGDDWEDTFPLRGRDGSYRWFLSRAEPQRAADGRIMRWFGTNTDVTEQREATAAMRRSELRFRTMIDASADVIWLASADGRLIPPLPTWRAYTGQTEEQYGGWGWLDVIHDEDRDRVAEAWREALRGGSAFEIDYRIRRRDGEWRFAEARAAPILEADGSIGEWVGFNTDITERKRVAQDLEAARDAAEAANTAKSQFIANMSHELRTPLSAVIGYSEMLAEEIEDLGQSQLLGDVAKIEGSARHLLGLINDVLDLSKIEAGRMTVSSEWFETTPLVEDIAEQVGALVEKKGNRLDLDLGPDLGRMRSDDLKIRQCLMNLIGNAAKFTENGTITLRVRRLAEDMVFEVGDSGIGMTPEQVARLFQRFSQADESTTRQFGGTGLGLAITKAFAERLGGGIAVESREGEGSTFRLTVAAELPPEAVADDTAPAQPGAAETEGRSDGGNRVLVVDDDPAARDLLSRFLIREGFAASTAADGQTGLSMARSLRPRAILLDVEMPRMDGWSVLHALRSDPDLAATPVIMVSVVNEKGLGFALGATDYLVKPIEWDRLKAIMDRLHPHKEGSTVMLIDDDADARQRLRFMLSREGWSVTEAANGREALDELARSGPPGLILLDLMMPVMDGFDFLRRLRQRPDGGLVPVVVLTAKDVTPEERADLDQKADRVISKGSIRLSDLAHELRALIPPDK